MQQFNAPFSLKIVVISLVSTSEIAITSFSFRNSSKDFTERQLLGFSQNLFTTTPEE